MTHVLNELAASGTQAAEGPAWHWPAIRRGAGAGGVGTMSCHADSGVLFGATCLSLLLCFAGVDTFSMWLSSAQVGLAIMRRHLLLRGRPVTALWFRIPMQVLLVWWTWAVR